MDTKEIDVSVILPALFANDDFNRCVYSIKTALSRLNFEIIIIVNDIDKFNGFIDSDIKIFQEEKSGIYGAMNKGIKEAKGHYIYFIGQDDILLPCAAKAITIGKKKKIDLIVANVFYGKNSILNNRKSRKILIWKNWCHQGILYNRLKFIDTVGFYPIQFKSQSDHYVNIIYSGLSNIKSIKYKGCIAWYSGNGFSSHFKDFEFRNIFPKLILKNFGILPYLVVLIRRILLSIFVKIMIFCKKTPVVNI